LQDIETTNRPARRIALISREIDITALSETRWAEEGQLKEIGADYTFFWIGHPKEERREAGVGFAMKSNIVSKLESLPKGVNHHPTITLFQLSNKIQNNMDAPSLQTLAPDPLHPGLSEGSKLDLQLVPLQRPQGGKPPIKLNVAKLKAEGVKDQLRLALEKHLSTVNTASGNIEMDWKNFRDALYSAASKTLGSKHQDWFEENYMEIKQLLNEKHTLHLAWLNDPSSASKKAAYYNKCKEVQIKLRTMQDKWWSDKAKKPQMYADKNDMK
uniref:Uncharacterized protein n=1 Tax=Latimeria chalumnae TaxID=7897 RepID=H3AK59_LATCH